MSPIHRNDSRADDVQAFLNSLRGTAPAPDGGGLTTRAWLETGRVEVVGLGFWTSAAVEYHLRELADIADALHAAGIPARVLIDVSKAPVQSVETAERIGKGTRRLWLPQDRVAVVVSSTLASMQITRVVDDAHRMFADMAEAEAWLAR